MLAVPVPRSPSSVPLVPPPPCVHLIAMWGWEKIAGLLPSESPHVHIGPLNLEDSCQFLPHSRGSQECSHQTLLPGIRTGLSQLKLSKQQARETDARLIFWMAPPISMCALLLSPLGGKRKHPISPITLPSMNSSYPDREVCESAKPISLSYSKSSLSNGKSSTTAPSF